VSAFFRVATTPPVVATMPLEVFAEDGNTILGRGSVTVEYVAEDGDIDVLRIDGGVEWEVRA